MERDGRTAYGALTSTLRKDRPSEAALGEAGLALVKRLTPVNTGLGVHGRACASPLPFHGQTPQSRCTIDSLSNTLFLTRLIITNPGIPSQTWPTH